MSKKLLLADDSVTIQKVVGLIFANGEYDLECVSNGDAAFEKISFERPDIVLADVNMPGKNGFELCSAIKNNPASSDVPVLLLVGSFEPFDEDQARSAGADGWIIKPFESQDLIDEVEGLLSRPAEAVSWPEPGGAADTAEPDMWADLELDNMDVESAGETGALAETFSDEPESGGIELEEENLWEEDQPVSGESQPEVDSAVDEEGLAGEDDILFIDEDDLLDDEPEQIAVSAFVESETPIAEPEALTVGPETFTAEPETFTAEPDAPAEDSLPIESAMEMPPEPAEWPAVNEVQPAAEAPPHPVPEKSGLEFWRNDGLITRLATPAAQPLAEVETPSPVAEPVEAVAPSKEESAGPGEEEVVARVQALSEEDLGRIVERVAGTVIERLAGSILEKIAWEVVPDLAEGLIKEEIRKITETSH